MENETDSNTTDLIAYAAHITRHESRPAPDNGEEAREILTKKLSRSFPQGEEKQAAEKIKHLDDYELIAAVDARIRSDEKSASSFLSGLSGALASIVSSGVVAVIGGLPSAGAMLVGGVSLGGAWAYAAYRADVKHAKIISENISERATERGYKPRNAQKDSEAKSLSFSGPV